MTFVALSGSNARAALPGVTPGSRRPSAAVEIIKGYKVAALRPILSVTMADVVYEQRAWTFQERLLSKRCLIFTDQQVYYQCHSQPRSDFPGGLKRKEFLNDSIPVFVLGHHPPLPDIIRPNKEPSIFSDQRTSIPGSRAFSTYVSLVERYSFKALSDPLDALNAFSGIVAVLEHQLRWNFVCGIPKEFLDLCLLWAPIDLNKAAYKRNAAFSRWSWAGWIGPSLWSPMYNFEGCFHSNSHNTILKTEVEELETTDENLSAIALGRFQKCASTPLQRNPDAGETSDLNARMDRGILSLSALVASLSSFESISDCPSTIPCLNLTFTSLKNVFSQRCSLLFMSDLSLRTSKADYGSREFVLLSRYHRSESDFLLTGPAVDPFRSKYDHICDSAIFPFSPWCLLNIMPIEWKGSRAERLAIGLIHENAWESARPIKQHVLLR